MGFLHSNSEKMKNKPKPQDQTSNVNSNFDKTPESRTQYSNHVQMLSMNLSLPPPAIEEDDEEGDYDDEEDLDCTDNVNNVSNKNATTLSTECYSESLTFKVASGATKTATTTISTDSLRRRNVNKREAIYKSATKPKSVQFMPLPEFDDDEILDSANQVLKQSQAKPLKKIIFNGTFPIDDPYSSRF